MKNFVVWLFATLSLCLAGASLALSDRGDWKMFLIFAGFASGYFAFHFLHIRIMELENQVDVLMDKHRKE